MLWVLVGSVSGCATASPPPPTHLARKIAVLPVNNRTGDPLAVAGSGLVEGYLFPTEEITVSDVLAWEARSQLKLHGFEVIPPKTVESALKGTTPSDPASALEAVSQDGLGTLGLYLEIRRWEAEVPMHPKYVLVGLTACLVDPATRRVVWQVERPPAPVATLGVLTMESAYVAAARKVIEKILAPLYPDPPPPR